MSNKIRTFDIVLFILPVIFIVTSVAVIYSLVLGTIQYDSVLKQVIAAIIGLVLMIVTGFIDYRLLRGTSWIFYLIAIALLVVVDLFGKTVNGAANWLDLGFFNLQPSELAKAFVIFYLAAFFSSKIGKVQWKDILVSGIALLIPLGLILKEPDLGTALVIVCIYLVILFVSRPAKQQTIIILSAIFLASALFFLAAFNVKPFGKLLHEYQRKRIMVFIHPDLDPIKWGYNVRQAQISVGSGGVFGKGLGNGTQSQLQFLPEPTTDFIFAGISESFGFVGSATILVLYFYLISKIISIAHQSQDNFGLLTACGVAAMFSFQVLVNVGMNIGLAPVTGIPLPLLSYGGSSMIASLLLIGVVQSIFIRHKKISF